MLKVYKAELLKALDGESAWLLIVEQPAFSYDDAGIESRTVIFKNTRDYKFYSFEEQRSGSPYSDWYYFIDNAPDELLLSEVVKRAQLISYWVAPEIKLSDEATKAAEWLKWFYDHADFGSNTAEVIRAMQLKYQSETGNELPKPIELWHN